MDVSQYLEIFLDETNEHLQNLNTQILELESDPENMDNINEIFRAAHSLKGMAGTMGYKRMETLTHDKKNVIMQTYTIWSIADPLRYYTSVGDTALAETYLSDLVTSAKNGTMGNYDLSALVSLDEEDIKIDEIEAAMLQEVQSHALEQYGIQVHELRLKRVGLPATNVQSVFTQMQADRQKYIDQLLAEGERDAQIIMSESDAEVAAIVAEGREEAAAINAETEREVAEIYASAHSQDPELYEFLQKLAALENSVDEDTVMIITMDTPPFDVLYGDD